MDHNELVRLAGEQALLAQEVERLEVEQARDMRSLEVLPSHILVRADWLNGSIDLLRRLDTRQRMLAQGRARLDEYRKLTGIKP